MRRGHKKNPKHIGIGNKSLLILLSILCISSILFSFVAGKNTAPVTRVANYVLSPMQEGMSHLATGLRDLFSGFRSSKALQEENTALKKRIEELNTENTTLAAQRAELDRLHKQLSMTDAYGDREVVGARVIAKDPGNWFNIFTINVGTKQGIEPNMNVVADGALVGIVTSVSPTSSTVRTVIDDLSAVSGVVQGKDNLLIVEGNLKTMREGYIPAKDIHAEADIRVGDKIVTSAVSERFLPDILIGYVTEVNADDALLIREAKIAPVVNFNTLREVLVIKELKQTGE
ncbi:MAG: rod shape-determining protein MreC [Eubacteriales bacterium]|nr:rod shape-determining protein MreC [Eubacteriales bacterium]